MSNYIPDRNRFNLAVPPQFWLKQLHDFDDTLVVIPSRMGFFYRLAQKRPPDAKTLMTHRLQGDSDSQMLSSYGLVPVTTIISQPRWDNPMMFEDLRQRMPSRMGGAQAYEKRLIEQEQMKDLRERADRDDMLTSMAKDALGYYKKQAGRRTSMWVPHTKDRIAKPTFGQSAGIKIVGKYAKLEQHIKDPYSVKD